MRSPLIPVLVACTVLASASAEGPLRLGLKDAILSTLENNPSLRAQRYLTASRETYEKEELGAFDSVASVTASGYHDLVDPQPLPVDSGSVTAGVEAPFSTGTRLAASAKLGKESISSSIGTKPLVAGEVKLSQSFLQGGLDVRANLARVESARLDAFASRFELKGFTENLVYNAEKAYWDYYLALKELDIYRDSLKLAEQNLFNTRQRVDVGRLPELELAAARVDVAERKEALIGAEGNVETARLKLLQIAGPKSGDFWEREIEVADRPVAPEVELDSVVRHVEAGKKSRPDLNQARLSLEKGELEVVRTRNGLLPRLDFFISYGVRGYADSFGGAAGRLFDQQDRVTAGLTFTRPLGNNAAEARADRAKASREQLAESLLNLERLVEVEIRAAFSEVKRSKARTAATAETALLQGDKLAAENEKYLVGRSTSYAVGQAQRDLLSARLQEVRAVVTHILSVLNLYRLEGTLLERRGIETISTSS